MVVLPYISCVSNPFSVVCNRGLRMTLCAHENVDGPVFESSGSDGTRLERMGGSLLQCLYSLFKRGKTESAEEADSTKFHLQGCRYLRCHIQPNSMPCQCIVSGYLYTQERTESGHADGQYARATASTQRKVNPTTMLDPDGQQRDGKNATSQDQNVISSSD